MSTEQKPQYYHSLGSELHKITLIPQLISRNTAFAFVGYYDHISKSFLLRFCNSLPTSAPMVSTFLPAVKSHTEISKPVTVAGPFSCMKNYACIHRRATKSTPSDNYSVSEHEALLQIFLSLELNQQLLMEEVVSCFSYKIMKVKLQLGAVLQDVVCQEKDIHTKKKNASSCVFILILRFAML